MIYGTDISAWQDTTSVPYFPDDTAVIIKTTQGTTYVNGKFGGQVQDARVDGQRVGYYHFADGENATAEADYFVGHTAYAPGDVLALDWEGPVLGMAIGTQAAWIDEFCTHVEQLTGFRPWLYCSLSVARDLVGTAAQRSQLWCAQYWDPASRDKPMAYPGDGWTLAAWQWTSSPVDRDVFYNWADSPTPTTPPPTPVPAPTLVAPTFPLPGGWYFGPKEGPQESVSGYYGHQADLAVWQQRMHDRGWTIGVDGLYGPETASIATAFQQEKGLAVDGLIGPQTWAAAWTEPVT